MYALNLVADFVHEPNEDKSGELEASPPSALSDGVSSAAMDAELVEPEDEVPEDVAAPAPVVASGKHAGKVRYASRNWALTYPNMPLDSTKDGVINKLKAKFAGRYKYIRVCREMHKSGMPHYHVFIAFSKKTDYLDSRWADIDIDGNRHPNIKVCYKSDGWISYMSKSDKEHLEDGEDKYSASSKTVWKDVLTDLTLSESEVFDMLIKSGKGRDVALNADRIIRSVQVLKKAKNPANSYVKSSLYRLKTLIPTAIQWWLDNEFIKVERAKCLIVVGATRLGKTALFRGLFPQAIFWRNAVLLDTFDENAPCIIMDDIYWDYIPNKKTYLTQMGEATVTSKYRQMTRVNVKMPCIVLLNEMPVFSQEAKYWKDNTYIVQLEDHPLYGDLKPGYTLDNMAYVYDYDLSTTHVSNDVKFP